MRALTIWQPWASLAASGLKRYETRAWATKYRGRLAIHAGRASYPDFLRLIDWNTADLLFMEAACREAGILSPASLHRGMIVGTAELVGCHQTFAIRHEQDAREIALGDWSSGRWAWELADARLLERPIPCSGRQGLWNLPDELIVSTP